MKQSTNYKWVITVTLVSIMTSMVFTFVSTEALESADYVVAFVILALFIVIGIIFDIIGIAVTAADEKPFHSMASHKVRGAAESIRLIRNADRVSNVCNDVVGDISGIVSGVTAATISARLMADFNIQNVMIQLLTSGLVAGFTIGGKAMGKAVAINRSTQIVAIAGRIVSGFSWVGRKKKKR